MTYTSTANVKNTVGATNVPDTVTAPMIVKYILRADAFIDAKSGKSAGGWVASYNTSTEDADTPRLVEAASANLSGAYLLRRMAAEEQLGTKYTTGPISEEQNTRQQEFYRAAKALEKDAMEMIKEIIAAAGNTYLVHRTL